MTDYLATPDAHLRPEVAESYDAGYADMDTSDVVELLAELADGGAAVEFAIGTGRIAVPLSQAGVSVSGMDFSEPMLAQLRMKPESASIETALGDMTSTVMGQDFSLAYLVFNTIMNLRSQAGQVACFKNAAAHLRPGGRFVIEVIVPEVHRLGGQTVVPFGFTDTHVGFDDYVDRVDQILISHHVNVADGVGHRSANAFRYVWPSELDLMAQIAGMDLEHRWADWSRNEFTEESPSHVSVWRKPGHS